MAVGHCAAFNTARQQSHKATLGLRLAQRRLCFKLNNAAAFDLAARGLAQLALDLQRRPPEGRRLQRSVQRLARPQQQTLVTVSGEDLGACHWQCARASQLLSWSAARGATGRLTTGRCTQPPGTATQACMGRGPAVPPLDGAQAGSFKLAAGA